MVHQHRNAAHLAPLVCGVSVLDPRGAPYRLRMTRAVLGYFPGMDTPERCEEIAKTLTAHGYKVEPTDDYLNGLAARLKNAGWDVTPPADDDSQAEVDAGADQPAATGRARRATTTGDKSGKSTAAATS
jgi:hypothetical protein